MGQATPGLSRKPLLRRLSAPVQARHCLAQRRRPGLSIPCRMRDSGAARYRGMSSGGFVCPRNHPIATAGIAASRSPFAASPISNAAALPSGRDNKRRVRRRDFGPASKSSRSCVTSRCAPPVSAVSATPASSASCIGGNPVPPEGQQWWCVQRPEFGGSRQQVANCPSRFVRNLKVPLQHDPQGREHPPRYHHLHRPQRAKTIPDHIDETGGSSP